MVAATALVPSALGGDSWSMVVTNCPLMAWASCAALCGLSPTTSRSRVAVFVGTVTVTCLASCSGVVTRASLSITGCSTISVRATFANDCT